MDERALLLKADYKYLHLSAINFLHLCEDDYNDVLEVRNHEKVRMGSFNQRVVSLDEHKTFLNNLRHSDSRGHWRAYRDGGETIGVISLTSVDFRAQSAELGYYKDFRCEEGGVGKILVNLAVQIAFDGLGLTKIYAEAFDSNIASQKSMKAVGFKPIGETKRVISEAFGKVYLYELTKDR